jgi:glycosyltransferase involved in cell wall biosynthesis
MVLRQKLKACDTMKTMLVLFENLEQVHLGKDVGALPLAFQKNTKGKFSICSTLNKFTDNDFEKRVDLLFFTRFKSRTLNKLMMFIHVIKNAKEIDYLMVFHGGKDKSILFWLCKIINKHLVTYVKLDMGEANARVILDKNLNESFLKKTLRYVLSKPVDLFTVETNQVFEMIKELPQYRNKLHYLPNGFYAESAYNWAVPKEKMIISVGRIGTPPKNNELLLKAIELLDDLGEYKFYFIGPVESSFQVRVDALLQRREGLRDRVILTGNITDKEDLYCFYKRAEVLCFTSLHEGFSLVMVEASYFGCYLLSTDLSAAYDLTDDGKHGQIVKVNQDLIDDCAMNGIIDIVQYSDNNFEEILSSEWFTQSSRQLSDSLQSVIGGEVDINIASQYLAKNTYENFNWISVANNLYNLFESSKRVK